MLPSVVAALFIASTVAPAVQRPVDDLAAALAAAGTAAEREALLSVEPDLVDTALVLALGRIASSAAAAQQFRRAQSLFEYVVDLARRTGSAREEGEALQNLGNSLYFQRRFQEALVYYERRVALEAQRADDGAMARALAGLATTQYSLAEYSEALKRYRLALAIQERLDDRAGSASTLISIGNIRYLQGDYSSAIRDYARSGDLYLGSADTDGHARALEGLGRTYSAQGDYAAALTAFAGVLAEGRARGDRARQGSALQSTADTHLRLGNVDAARSHYEQSRDHFLALKDLGAAGRVWQGLGMTELLAGRYAQAEQAYTKSVEICGTAADSECSAQAVVGLAFAQSAQEKFKEAIDSYRTAIDRFSALGWKEAAARAHVGLSQALVGADDVPAAMEAAAEARRTAIALGADDVLWRALTAEARALRKRGTTGDAIAAARAAATVVERMHGTALEKPARPIPSDASAAFATLAVLQAGAGDHAGAWSSASRVRAVALRSVLAVNERDIARGMTTEEQEEERRAASELSSLNAQAARERSLPKPDATRLATLDERIATVAAARSAWMQSLYARLPDLRAWRGAGVTAIYEDLDAVLESGTVLLEYLVDDDDVLVLLSERRADRIETITFSRAIRRRVLAERVNALLQMPPLRDPAQWRRIAGDLGRLLLPEAETRLATAARIIVVPHDVLWRVPFEALPVGGGYLGDRPEITSAGSLDMAIRAIRLEGVSIRTVLAVAAPALAGELVARVEQTAPGWTLRASEAAQREVTAVLTTYPEGTWRALKGSAATERAATGQSAKASALHIAAPFRINGASPLFSSILFAAGSTTTASDNGTLEAREIINLDVRSRVLVLSDGAATSMLDGAAAASIVQWAWLAAGVPALVMSRWTGDPVAGDAFLVELHRRLQSGTTVPAAMRDARAALRKHPKWAAPYYWAGWMGLGF